MEDNLRDAIIKLIDDSGYTFINKGSMTRALMDLISEVGELKERNTTIEGYIEILISKGNECCKIYGNAYNGMQEAMFALRDSMDDYRKSTIIKVVLNSDFNINEKVLVKDKPYIIIGKEGNEFILRPQTVDEQHKGV